ncbi:hypothetical protein FHG87_001357 [Trinorchestia longiramus]|nr:hypothetical protein FHG87_001357 [Trinorchestia longiramus]
MTSWQLSMFLSLRAAVIGWLVELEPSKKAPNRLLAGVVTLSPAAWIQATVLSVFVENKPTLCSPLTLSAFKNGISVPLFKTLHPNNGLRFYTQFDETVRLVLNYDIPFDKTIQNVVTLLQAHTSACVHTEKEKKLVFLTRQLELLLQKQFSMNDYCFALQSYPKCNYEQLRDFLVLPCKRKLQYITSYIHKDQVLREAFDKVQTLQQKNVFLLVD